MERNEKALSTRDLASPDDPRAEEAMNSTQEGAGGTSSAQARAEVYDRPAGSGVGGLDSAPSAPQDETVLGQALSTASPAEPAPQGIDDAVASTAPARAEGSTDPAADDSATRPAADDSATRPAADDSATDPAAVESATRPAAADNAADPAAADGPAVRTGAEGSTEQPLLTADDGASFQRRWEEVQTRFVDEPRGAVQDADALVANLMQRLAQGFAQERERLEAQWDRGEDISTEDLRVALQRYRSFFQRLLTT